MKNSELALQLMGEAANNPQNSEYAEWLENEKRMAEEKEYSKSYYPTHNFFMVVFSAPELSGIPKKSGNNEVVAEHYIKLTVNWKGMNYGDKIKNAKTKKSKLTGNADFPTPWSSDFVTLIKFGTDITDADAKLISRSMNEPGSARSLGVAVKLLYSDCKNIGTMIQLKMDSCVPDEAIRICLAAGYTYKAIVVRGKRKNRVRQMTEPGWVQVEGEGEGGRNWQFSLNPFNAGEIKDLEYTTGGVTTYNVGQSRVDAWFRWRLLYTKGKHGDWSEWFKGETP